MVILWIVLAVVAVTGAVIVMRTLAQVLAAARQLQRNVESLGESVSAELKRLGGDMAQLGDDIDDARRR